MERISDWHDTLAASGARTGDDGLIIDFGDQAAEGRATDQSAVVVPLTGTGLISVSGPDAASFLNAQFTSDVATVSPRRAQYTGYCTPKGRLLATMLLFEHGGGFWLSLPAELVAPVTARLQKFVLRAKVRLQPAGDDLVMFGIAGPQAPACLANALAVVPAQVFEVTHADGMALINLPGGRYLLVCQADQASALWLKLTAHLHPAGWNWWQLQTIRAGIATVTLPTQEAFVPQMLGLDAYAAVSFSKGCYPGQEIVARTHYLGDLKRHLYYGHCDKSLAVGETIVDSGSGEAVGAVTDAAVNAEQGCEFLAVLRKDTLEPTTNLGNSDGARVTFLSAAADRLARSSS